MSSLPVLMTNSAAIFAPDDPPEPLSPGKRKTVQSVADTFMSKVNKRLFAQLPSRDPSFPLFNDW
jgi:hypothetical protein